MAVPPAVVLSLHDLLLAKYFFLAFYTVLLYDHLCTLQAELQTFWKKRKTPFLYLFIFVRYYAPLAMSVVAFAFFSPKLTLDMCRHWMYFLPIAVTLGLMILCGALMAVRVYALWGKNRLVLGFCVTYLTAQAIVGIWSMLLPGGKPFPYTLNNYQFHYCVYVAPTLGRSSSLVYVLMDLCYDIVVFLLTVSRTLYIYHMGRGARRNGLVYHLARDGSMYFGGIFVVNFIWVIMIYVTRPGLHALLAMPQSIINVILVTRITLNLREAVHGPAVIDERTLDGIALSDFRPSHAAPKAPRFSSRVSAFTSNDVALVT
ncbi:hypothetical protein FA95DRAFT_887547 [Auriscalpium vulgare]|uniref:Uncharacterized protein n=1 Tax=Auriscalpium vulgare TaxID=40419 RepID=A0ACB8R8J6_9AGAM|nr:hypothetical protein FA95DRAFT_887547 [Auriscalpium vulgare]